MCAYIPEQLQNTGLYVQTTQVWELAQIANSKDISPDLKELLVRLYQQINNIALALNQKDSALYLNQEFVNSQNYFNLVSTNPLDLRPVFRIVINIGALAAGVTNTAHGLTITNTWKFTRIYGAASNTATSNYYPLPFAGAAGNNIELRVNAANVVINNNSGVVFTDCYVVLEYLKN